MRCQIPVFVFILLLAFLAGCAQESNSEHVQSNDENQSAEENSEIETNRMNIKLYFSDNEALGVVETTKDILFEDEVDKYRQAYLALTAVSDEKMTTLWTEDGLADIRFEEGVLDLELDIDEIQQGSAAERMQMLTLFKTMFQFPEVNEIRINDLNQQLYGGQIDISTPFTRDALADL